MNLVIQFVTGARAGQIMELAASPTIRFGRRPGNDVVFDVQKDLDVSGHHAEIRTEADGLYLYDVGSANGTFVDGVRVTRLRLSNGQEIAMGPSGPKIVVSFTKAAVVSASPVAASAAPPAGGGAVVPVQQQASAQSAGQAAAAGLQAGKKVGARTVAMMIDAAMSKSKSKTGVGKSTMFFRSMVNQSVTRSTRRFKFVLVLLALTLVGAVGGLLVLRHFERKEARAGQEQLRKQMADLMTKQTGAASSAEKQRLATKLALLNRKLAAVTQAAGSGKEIVQRNLKAIFLMAYRTPLGAQKGFCTAFAVGKRLLATNAHCVKALERFRTTGLTTFIVMNRAPRPRYTIPRVVAHPRYHKPVKSISEDVGLLFVDVDLPTSVQLADNAALKKIDSGDIMYTYGFPGRLAKVSSPSATLVQGVVGRVTKLNGEFGGFDQNKLIQHSAFTSGGTSGSPIFNRAGQVIAVNAGGYVEPGTMQVMDPMTGRARKVQVAKQLAGYNFGIRVDVLSGLMKSTPLR